MAAEYTKSYYHGYDHPHMGRVAGAQKVAQPPDTDLPPSAPAHTPQPRESAEHTPHQGCQQITQIYEGTNQVQRLVMGRKLLA